MYNGIGLATARGSGTNGYVTRNWAAVKKVKDQTSFKTEEELAKIDSASNRQPNQELLDHDRKRKVELKCIELEQSLEDQGYSQDEITDKINTFRTTLLGKQKSGTEYDEFGRPIVKDTHQYADEQLKKNARLRDAFGISEFFIEGSSLDPERKTKEAALAQLKALQVDQAVAQTQMNDDTSTNKDSSIMNELQSKSPKHKKRKKKKSKSHKTEKEKGSDKKKSKKHKKKHVSSSEDSPRDDEAKNSPLQIKSKCDFDKANKLIIENSKKKYESENNHKKHPRDDDKTYKNDKRELESKYKSDRGDYRRKDSKTDSYKNSKNKDIVHESKKQENSPRHTKSPVKGRDRDRARDSDKYSYRHQRSGDDSKSIKEKYNKKSDRADSKYNSKKRNESPVKEFRKPTIQPEKLTCITSGSDSEKSCYTPPPKDMNATYTKLGQPKINEEKNVKGTKYTFSLREQSEDRLVLTKANGRPNNIKFSLQNNETQLKKLDSQKTNERVDKIFLDSSSSEAGELDGDIDLNIIKEITTEKIKKVFELHEKQEQALLHLKKKLMEKKRKVRTSSSSSESSEEPVKKKSVKRRRIRDSSSSVSDMKKKSKRLRSSRSSSRTSDTSIDRHKSSKRRSSNKYSKKKSPLTRRRTKRSTSRSVSISSIDRIRKNRISSSEESSPRRKHKSSKRKRSSRRQRSSDSSSSSSRSSSSYKKRRRYSSSRSRSTSSSSSSHYSRSSSSSHDSSSSVSSRSSKSRSASIPRRRGSPSFLDRRRITSARKRPIPYTRLTPFSTNSDTDSAVSVHDSPYAESH